MYNTKDVYFLAGFPCDYCRYDCYGSCKLPLPVRLIMYCLADDMILRGEY